MLRHALQEPLNQRFLLVSESCVPLYPPTTFYASLMADDKSRINACKLPHWHRQAERYLTCHLLVSIWPCLLNDQDEPQYATWHVKIRRVKIVGVH